MAIMCLSIKKGDIMNDLNVAFNMDIEKKENRGTKNADNLILDFKYNNDFNRNLIDSLRSLYDLDIEDYEIVRMGNIMAIARQFSYVAGMSLHLIYKDCFDKEYQIIVYANINQNSNVIIKKIISYINNIPYIIEPKKRPV